MQQLKQLWYIPKGPTPFIQPNTILHADTTMKVHLKFTINSKLIIKKMKTQIIFIKRIVYLII